MKSKIHVSKHTGGLKWQCIVDCHIL